jgi:PAS domain S-box-containing protein
MAADTRQILTSEHRSAFFRYAIAVIVPGIALLATVALAPFRPSAETPVFVLAVGVVAWYGGAGPALLCTVLSALCLDVYVFPPRLEFALRLQDVIGLGWFFAASGVIAAIANRKSRAVRELEANENVLRQFVRYTPTPVAMFDERMCYMAVSQSWYKTYNIAEGSLIGRCHYDVVPDIPERWKEIHRQCLLGIPARAEEDEFQRADGSVEYVRWEVQPWKRSDGTTAGMIMFAELVTARKHQEEALRLAERLASAGRLAATVAHEINNPLEAVTNLLYLAQSDPERAGDYLSRADQELRRVAQITRQTLGFYRDTGGPGWTDISEVADEVLRLYEVKLKERALHVRRQLSPGCRVWAKEGEIGQVISNLLVNAVDASPPGGQVTLRIAPATNWKDLSTEGVRITLSDCGCGIAPENKARVFDPFWTTKKNTGTGLGLWVAQSLMTNLGGTITMRSSVRPGRSGTVFSVFVPCGKPDSATELMAGDRAKSLQGQ